MSTLVAGTNGSDSDELLSDRIPPRPRSPYQRAIGVTFGLVCSVVTVSFLANQYSGHATPAASHTKVDANLRGNRPSGMPGSGEENAHFAELLDDYGTDMDGDLIDAVMGEGNDAHVDERLDELLEDDADDHDHEGEGDYAGDDATDVDELAQSLEQKWAAPHQGHQKNWHGKNNKFHSPWSIFKMADKDENGVLEGSEVDSASQNLQKRFKITPENFNGHLSIESASSRKLDMQTFKHLLVALHTFASSDQDQSGLLSPDELYGVSKMLHHHFRIDDGKFEELFPKADANGDGSLSSIELHNLLSGVWQNALPPKMEFFFKISDRDQSGYIDGGELEILARELQSKFLVPAEEYQEAFSAADMDSDRTLSPKDYKQLINELMKRSGFQKMHPAMLQLFKAADKDRDGSVKGSEATFLADKLEDKFGLSPEKYKEVAKSVGADGTLDMNKYKKLFSAEMKSSPFAQMCPRLAFLFKQSDADNNLVLEGSELDTLSKKLEERFGVDAATYQKAFAASDGNSDRKLQPQEFKPLIKHLKEGKVPSRPARKPEVASTGKKAETFSIF